MAHLEGMGRLIACDLIGMGGSEKLSPLGPDRYRYAEHRDYLFALWDSLDLGDRVVLVLDDWGAVLGLNWIRENSQRVQGIVRIRFTKNVNRAGRSSSTTNCGLCSVSMRAKSYSTK